MNTLAEWTELACRELKIDSAEVRTGLVLDLAKEIAHGVVRPGAPVTAYLLGLAVGRGADPADAAGRLTALARSWPTAEGEHEETAAG